MAVGLNVMRSYVCILTVKFFYGCYVNQQQIIATFKRNLSKFKQKVPTLTRNFGRILLSFMFAQILYLQQNFPLFVSLCITPNQRGNKCVHGSSVERHFLETVTKVKKDNPLLNYRSKVDPFATICITKYGLRLAQVKINGKLCNFGMTN